MILLKHLQYLLGIVLKNNSQSENQDRWIMLGGVTHKYSLILGSFLCCVEEVDVHRILNNIDMITSPLLCS